MPRNADKIRCGVPGCRAWAIRGSNPPRCSPHSGQAGPPPDNQNRLTHGFYADVFRAGEFPDLDESAADSTLSAEILITRAAIRRLFRMIQSGSTLGPDPQPLTADDYARFIALIFQGSGCLSRLLRTRAALHADIEPMEEFERQVLEGVAEKLGVDLLTPTN